jgi:hypothetical protein
MSEATAYKAIVNFINELNEVFGESQRSLRLYSHLLSKTSPAHKMVVAKHIDSFRKFCVANREAILTKSKLVKDTVVYSKKVYVDIQSILNSSDRETAKVIWTHIMTISALVDPTAKVKELLKSQAETSGDNEVNFLTNMMSKVESHVDASSLSSQMNSNPMNVISGLMTSGIFNDIVSNMGSEIQDGNLDFGKLIGTVQNMMTTITNNDPQAMNMINSIMTPLMTMASTPCEGCCSSLDRDSTPVPPLSELPSEMQELITKISTDVNTGHTEEVGVSVVQEIDL